MECNKEEALKAKEVAEKKFVEKDIDGAKRFALKAQNLFPNLDGISELLVTLDVYIAAKERINGKVDWYKILGVDPLADEATIQKQYKTLALKVHPDKNQSVGADGAFKIVSEVQSMLSNNRKRAFYDEKQNSSFMPEKVMEQKLSVPAGQNGATCSRSSFATSHEMRSTFWTTCNACKVQFEYLRVYLNQKLVCANCRQTFSAFEVPPPRINGNGSSTPWTSYLQRHNFGPHSMMKNTFAPGRMPTPTSTLRQSVFPGVESIDLSKKIYQVGGIGGLQAPSSIVAETVGGIHPTFKHFKRGHQEASLDATTEGMPRSQIPKKTSAGMGMEFSSSATSVALKGDRPQEKRCVNVPEMVNGHVEAPIKTGFVSEKAFLGTKRWNVADRQINCLRELSPIEIRNILMKKAKKEIQKKLNEWTMASVLKTPGRPREMEDNKKAKKVVSTIVKADVSRYSTIPDVKNQGHTKNPLPAKSVDDSGAEDSNAGSMSVPDPDFHDFDGDRTESSFGNNQVWAAYDEDDGMPRYYAMIHSVISLKPFKMKISWLNTKSNDELAPINWVASGFPKTSGDFRIGKHEIYHSLNSFSHKVKWIKGIRGVVRIYPTVGDVWALYRNWSPDWNELTPDEVIHTYDMVEVLEVCNEELGVSVVPLVKVAGLKTVFRRHSDPSKIRKIPREEMFRLSHRVPSVFLTGQESQNAPKDCWELDPAATPLELLQVVTQEQSEQIVFTAEITNGKNLMKSLESPRLELVGNCKTPIEKGLIQDARDPFVAQMIEKDTEQSKCLVYYRKRLREDKRL